MPSLKQINNTNAPSPQKKKVNIFNLLAWLVVLGVGAYGGWLYYEQRNVYTVPEALQTTTLEGIFAPLQKSKAKKVFWLGGADFVSIQKQRNIEYSIKYEGLDTFYEPQFYSLDDFHVSCTQTECFDGYITNLCSHRICIYIPLKHRVITTDEDHLYSDLHKYKNL